uniref:NIMA related kinase 1 n=1 Tax=Homo sapiens TaxID=9606 RepID=A0A8I5KT19_HUMAN
MLDYRRLEKVHLEKPFLLNLQKMADSMLSRKLTSQECPVKKEKNQGEKLQYWQT